MCANPRATSSWKRSRNRWKCRYRIRSTQIRRTRRPLPRNERPVYPSATPFIQEPFMRARQAAIHSEDHPASYYAASINRPLELPCLEGEQTADVDRKSTRLNSSHVKISYAVFCLKKKN